MRELREYLRFLWRLVFPVKVRGGMSVRCGFSRDFRAIAEKYGLWLKVEIRKDWHPPQHRIYLFRIVRGDEDPALPLPSGFVEEVREMVCYYHYQRTIDLLGVPLEFLVISGMTMAEIQQAQEEWNRHCENFWIGAGG